MLSSLSLFRLWFVVWMLLLTGSHSDGRIAQVRAQPPQPQPSPSEGDTTTTTTITSAAASTSTGTLVIMDECTKCQRERSICLGMCGVSSSTSSTEQSGGASLTVYDHSLCVTCRECMDVCTSQASNLVDNHHPANTDNSETASLLMNQSTGQCYREVRDSCSCFSTRRLNNRCADRIIRNRCRRNLSRKNEKRIQDRFDRRCDRLFPNAKGSNSSSNNNNGGGGGSNLAIRPPEDKYRDKGTCYQLIRSRCDCDIQNNLRARNCARRIIENQCLLNQDNDAPRRLIIRYKLYCQNGGGGRRKNKNKNK